MSVSFAKPVLALLGLLACVAGCAQPVPSTSPRAVPPPQAAPAPRTPAEADALAAQFVTVVTRMKPVAEQVCRESRRFANCTYQVVVDDRPGQPPNAFHTIDASGQPIIGFTTALIADARNADELAFVFGHEAAHHIAGHIPRSQNSAMLGAVLLGGIAAMSGADPRAVRNAQNIGAQVGARSYSKAFELEADELGTLITWRAGYDPARGSGFFNRLPDPGDQFLGSHPPNEARLQAVQRTLAQLRAGRGV